MRGSFEQVIRERVARFPIKRGKRRTGAATVCRWVINRRWTRSESERQRRRIQEQERSSNSTRWL